jgi:hypothetical protein
MNILIMSSMYLGQYLGQGPNVHDKPMTTLQHLLQIIEDCHDYLKVLLI